MRGRDLMRGAERDEREHRDGERERETDTRRRTARLAAISADRALWMSTSLSLLGGADMLLKCCYTEIVTPTPLFHNATYTSHKGGGSASQGTTWARGLRRSPTCMFY